MNVEHSYFPNKKRAEEDESCAKKRKKKRERIRLTLARDPKTTKLTKKKKKTQNFISHEAYTLELIK